MLTDSQEKILKRLAIAFTGQSNSGKTTLIKKIAQILINDGNKVCIIKHDPKDKAVFDIEGKDSFEFYKTGADVAVVSPSRTTIFKQETSAIEEMVELFGEFDYLLVEGLKWLPLPRICVARDELNQDYFEYSDILAINDTINKNTIPKEMIYFDLDDPKQIISWININAKRV
jgi:molybdopterin-guanine dinucleotide biosynthesis protein B